MRHKPKRRPKKQIGQIIANAVNTLQQLNTFWRQSNCPIAFKLIALDAVIKAKVLYGTSASQLNEPEQKRLYEFHKQCLRKVLK